jgi:hypothetical protein
MRTIGSCFVILLFSGLAAAQETRPLSPFELRGFGGWTAFVDESLIHHGLVGASVRISVVGGLGVEPEFTYLVGPGSDRDIVLAPVVSWEFGRGRVRPYVLGSVGGLWHSEGTFQSSGLIASAGFGLRTRVSDRWSVFGEYRMGWPPYLQVKAGVGYRF